MILDLSGKVALVTGATGGVGRACAEELAAQGATVRLSARSTNELDALAAELRATGAQVETAPGDVTEASTLERLVPNGREPDVFVHAAGHRFRYAKLHAEDEGDVAALWKTDYEAFHEIAKRCAVSMMSRRFGRIVAITSIGCVVSGAGTPHYTAVKAAVEGLIRALAVDYGRYGITANAVAPGFTRTDRFEARVGRREADKLELATSVRRIAEPSEIAAPVAFLCSPAASYVTGTTLVVSGGAHLNNAW